MRVEFTIEPFVEGQPGPHVTAALDAAEALGVIVEFGPFGSSFDAAADLVGPTLAAVVGAALEHGATHVTVDVSMSDTASPTSAAAATDGAGGLP